MENEFKASLIVSFLLHASFFLVYFVGARKTASITLPVEIAYFSSSGRAASPPAPIQAAPQKVTPHLQQDDIPVPAKNSKKAAPKKKEPAPVPSVPVRPPAEQPSDSKQLPGSAAGAAAPGTGGSPLSLDTKNFPYAYYTSTIVRKIGRSWQWADEFGRLKAVVYFRIMRDGAVSDAMIKDSSGDDMFDRQAIRAIRLSSPFPPLPEGYADDHLGVYFEFAYR